jgi:hypothetical protein
MVAVKAAAALLLASACAALACGGAQTPADTARAFLERVSRNPVHALPLLADDFHASHALRHSVPGDTEFSSRRPAPLPSDPAARRRELEAAQLGWLIAQKGRRVHFLDVAPIEERVEGDRASVAFRIRFEGAPPLVQRFALTRRDARSPWRIEAIEQEGVVPANLVQAFALSPSHELRRRANAWQEGGAAR